MKREREGIVATSLNEKAVRCTCMILSSAPLLRLPCRRVATRGEPVYKIMPGRCTLDGEETED